MMNMFEMIKYWRPEDFHLNLDRWTKEELKLILILLKKGKISLEGEE